MMEKKEVNSEEKNREDILFDYETKARSTKRLMEYATAIRKAKGK